MTQMEIEIRSGEPDAFSLDERRRFCELVELGGEFGLGPEGYRLSEEQAQAILELRLHRLTGMEHDKLLAEYDEKLIQIAEFLEILGNAVRLMEVQTNL